MATTISTALSAATLLRRGRSRTIRCLSFFTDRSLWLLTAQLKLGPAMAAENPRRPCLHG